MESKLKLFIFINLLYIIPSIYLFIMRSNMEFIAYVAIVLLIGIIIISFFKKKYLKLHELYLLSVWGFLHLMGGLIIFSSGHNLYQLILLDIINKGGGYVILKMDQLIHFYGFGLIAYIMFRVFSNKLKNTSSNLFIGFFAVMVAIGFGALNEVIEFIVVLSTEFNGVGDLFNMGFDLIFNLTGAIIGSIIQYVKINKIKKL